MTTLGNDVVDVSVATLRTCARKSDGTVWCWGQDLGYGTIPIVVSLDGVTSVTTGDYHVCATKTDGSVWCWGRNATGTLGDGTDKDSDMPVRVLGIDNLSSLALGADVTCGVKADHTLWCWGNGFWIDGVPRKGVPPTEVASVGNLVAEVSANLAYMCIRKIDGTAWCWGDDGNGELGDGTFGDEKQFRSKPVAVANLGNDVLEISTGHFGGFGPTSARLKDGTVWCFGSNGFGALGDGTMDGVPCHRQKCRPTPVKVALCR